MNKLLPALAACVAASVTMPTLAKPLDPRSILKAYFETGDTPTESQFTTFIDSTISVGGDGVSIMDWGGLDLLADNLDDDDSIDTFGSMNTRILSTSGQNIHGFEFERTMTMCLGFINEEGEWECEENAVFRSTTQSPDFVVGETIVWTLDAPVTLSLLGDPLATRTITAGTYLETTLLYLPSPSSATLVLGGLLATRRRR